MSKLLAKQFSLAKKEGRICSRCGWMVTKARWKKGKTVCGSCEGALKGVNVSWGAIQPLQEPLDKTGNAL